jgi:hypothetical protein
MALTETTRYFLGILDDGQIELRRTRVILDDGQEVGERHHRQVLEPGQDVSTFPVKVRQISAVVWTPAVVAAWQAAKAAREAGSFSG